MVFFTACHWKIQSDTVVPGGRTVSCSRLNEVPFLSASNKRHTCHYKHSVGGKIMGHSRIKNVFLIFIDPIGNGWILVFLSFANFSVLQPGDTLLQGLPRLWVGGICGSQAHCNAICKGRLHSSLNQGALCCETQAQQGLYMSRQPGPGGARQVPLFIRRTIHWSPCGFHPES